MDDRDHERLQGKLAPEAIGAALIQAGALLTGYELVKASILDGVKGFFTFGFTEDGWTVDPAYQRDVLSLAPKSRFGASVAWLVNMEALQPEHVTALDRIREHRHEVAHELARLLVDPAASVNIDLLRDLRGCMRALDRFWGGIEIDLDPEFDGQEIDLDGVRSGSGLLIDYLCDVAGIGDAPSQPHTP